MELTKTFMIEIVIAVYKTTNPVEVCHLVNKYAELDEEITTSDVIEHIENVEESVSIMNEIFSTTS